MAGLVCPFSAAHAEFSLPIVVQVPLILKLLTYEQRLMQTQEPVILIGFLFHPKDSESRGCFEQFNAQIESYADRTIHGHRVALVPLVIEDADRLRASLTRTHIDVLYVGPGNAARIKQISEVTRTVGTLTVTGDESYVDDGLSVAVVRRGEQPGITMNLAASRAEGFEWDARLLALCRVIR